MSENLSVQVRADGEVSVSSLSQIEIVVGQSVTFEAVDAAHSLYFSPDLIGILTPAPGASLILQSGQSVTYTFSSDDPGAYEIFFQPPHMSPPQQFDPSAADHSAFLLLLRSGLMVAPPPPPPPPIPNPIPSLHAHGIQGVTSNPVQTLFSAEPQERSGEAQTEGFITSNPIQT